MPEPSETLAVDANIILNAVLGFRSRPLRERGSARCALVISAEASFEVRHVLSRLDLDAPVLIEIAEEILGAIEVVEKARYDDGLVSAEQKLRNAVGSRNGGVSDAHTLALAWIYDADIWSHDRDFAGAGWPSRSSANLAAALAGEAEAEAQPV